MRLKTGLLAAIFTAWASLATFAQNDLPVYTVYIGPFVEATAADFEIFQSLGFPYAHSVGSNMYRIYMGGYTSLGEADQVANTLRSRGYTDATVQQLTPEKGQSVTVIQLGFRVLGQPLNWEEFSKTGPLNVLLQDKSIKITTEVFPDIEAAKTKLEEIRKMGFSDAFIKVINSAYLHEINAFYPQAVYVAPAPAPAPLPAPVAADPGVRTVPPQEVPQAYNQATAVPEAYNQPATTYAPLPPAAGDMAAKPSIRSNIKRNSAYELQKVLKDAGFLTTGLDGYYGKGTAAAFENAWKNNPRIQKYAAQTPDQATPGTLQYALNKLAENPSEAIPLLEASKVPVARAYLAYYYLATEGPSMKANDLMNGAVMEAYAKAVRPARTRFDYTSMYIFNDAEQIITPLAYVQVVSSTAVTTPCWLVQRHPEAASYAFQPDPALPKGNYAMPDCGGFLEWDELRILSSLAKEICGSPQPSENLVAEGRAKARGYLLEPKALSTIDQTVVVAWHNKMTEGLTNWASRDAMLKDMGDSFKMLYFQSYVLLEDFYMNKGLNANDAKNLSIATLRGLVGPYLDRFI